MGNLGRRIGLSQDKGDSNPGAAGGAVGGGILDLFSNGYFERQGDIFNDPGSPAPSDPQGLTATGGVISDYTDPGPGAVYRAHIFASSGTLLVTDLSTSLPNNVEYLVVGGGGGGGTNQGGGGGAGGYRTTMPEAPGGPGTSAESVVPVSAGPTSYSVVIGAGAAGRGPGSNLQGLDGTNTTFDGPTFTAVTSTGGGGGGSYSPAPGRTGGSGGGSGAAGPTGATPGGAAASPTQGYVGGAAAGSSSNHRAGGGGGAGAAGVAGVPGAASGPGGVGKTSTIAYGPTNTQTIAGGGGGSSEPGSDATRGNHPSNPNGAGGAPFGGGLGGGTGTSGLYSSGAGGGGGGASPNGSGGGGSGIVVVRYQIGVVASNKATGGAISYYETGGVKKTIHTFTNSGSFNTPGTFNETIEYVAVGGGGGGGTQHAGGGGAGGLTTASIPLNAGGTPINAAIVIGAGAQGLVTQSSVSGTPGDPHSGSNTTVAFPSPVTAGAGGGGGSLWGSGPPYGEGASMPLGSGGGGGMNQPPSSGAPDNEGTGGPQGNPGGRGWYHETYAGIGGGGGGAGSQGLGWGYPNPTAGVGGDGVQIPTTFRNPLSAPSATSPTFTPERGGGLGTPGPSGGYYLAGGGGGSPHPAWPYTGNTGASGGAGGGGRGGGPPSTDPTGKGVSAVQNTGSGGGAGWGWPVDQGGGGNGGSGIVLIAYPS